MANSLMHRGLMLAGEKTVTTNGTAERLISLTEPGGTNWRRVLIISKASNTNPIFVGGGDVSSSTNDGLAAGASITFESAFRNHFDASDIWIDVTTNGEGVDIWLTK